MRARKSRLNSIAVQLQSNFAGDLPTAITSFLASEGYTVPPVASAIEACILHETARRYRIVPRPRRVLRSRELMSHALSPDDAAGVERLAKLAEEGGDLNPFRSRQSLKAHFKDQTLLDWNLTHLHLRPLLPGKKLSEGGPNVLFVWQEDDSLYFVDVRKHGEWADHALFEIVRTNWPKLVERCVLSMNIPHTGRRITQAEREHARKSGLMIITAGDDGRLYMPPGGGATTIGDGADAVDAADGLLVLVHATERTYRNDARNVALRIEAATGKVFRRVRLRLDYDGNAFYVNHDATGWREIAIGP